MSQRLINKFVAVNPDEKFIRIGNDGYAYEVGGIELAHMCDNEEDAKRYLECWITGYPDMFGKFKVIPITISYDLDKVRP